jgi:hypothetical protein
MSYLDLDELADELDQQQQMRQALLDHITDAHGWGGLDDELGNDLLSKHDDDHNGPFADTSRESFDMEDHQEAHEAFEDFEPERLVALEEVEAQLSMTLRDLAKEEGTAIPDYDFENYAMDLARDVGMVDKDSIIYSYVDWESFAGDLKGDYSSFEYEGETYWIRSQ